MTQQRSNHLKTKPLELKNFNGPSLIANPAIVFCAVWSTTLFLLSLNMTKQIVPMENNALFMIIGNGIFAVIISILSQKRIINTPYVNYELEINLLKKYTNYLLVVWLIGTIIEIIVSGGLPIFWALSGQGFSKDYTDFGIPSVHGVMNAFYLQLFSAYFIIIMFRREKLIGLLLFCLLFWPILMLGRGIFLSVIMQTIGIFLLMRRVKIKIALSIILSALVNIWLFGVVGNLRGTKNPFEYVVQNEWIDFFNYVPDGFLWVYVYITSGANNIFYNTGHLVPFGNFEKTFSKLVPSFVWELLGYQMSADSLQFADANLNVSTMYAGSVSDFGATGGFVFGCILLFLANVVFQFASKRNMWAMMLYGIFFQVLVFSVFYDMFLLLPTIMQFFIALHFKRYCQIETQKYKIKNRSTASRQHFS
jgi:oligosaccharide repeat unit polymerase